MSDPKVVAVCLTFDRPGRWLTQAILCFLKENYENREMLIAEDAPGDGTSGVRQDTYYDSRISWIMCPPGLTIGAKRNLACSHAHGDILCVWDDDDFSAPGRIQDQVDRLQLSGKAVTGYRTMRFTDGQKWWTYHGVPDFALGTSLCYRRDWWESHPFPDKHIQEDCHFVYAAQDARQIVVAEAGDLMHATIHAGNTSCRSTKDKDGNPTMGANYVPCDPPPYWKGTRC